MEELALIYQITYDKLKYKFDSLFRELSLLEENNPIEHIKYRIKKMDSIEGKLRKKGKEVNLENIFALNDIVGVRIVCSFLDDMNTIIELLKRDQEFRILSCKNYVDSPKDNGYMSYHLNIEVPICFQNQMIDVKAEIQVRTMAMDMWASLEHKIWYKKEISLPEKMCNEIQEVAQVCRLIDERLNTLSQQASFHESRKGEVYPFMLDARYEIERLKYEAALQIIEKKIKVISEEYSVRHVVNPIEHVRCRLKSNDSIAMKIQREGGELRFEYLKHYVNDIAGVRIVCSFLSDLKELVTLIQNDPSITVISRKDYVENPKESGYRAYHLLVSVPVYLKSGVENVSVEIQIRTIAMDMWASLEHKLCYHKDVSHSLKGELHDFASSIHTIDKNMDRCIWKSKELLDSKKKEKSKVLVCP